ncbi:putative lipid-binding transport protein (Tim44 family) [Kushneria sinocarnis]|uniref:Putative lipid-binding transport protein (Tim44 family) n=1 Tax=Kushneria sinocarnis TaxID=595502 RepID=A0A420WXV8_9GAMM|nr:TIM44-like domain-containing protein [Kushneria sinocarnis]RKR04550.1 putative lipid-binding transport protein (Tim44 family) [Kushneria sinocarnis]
MRNLLITLMIGLMSFGLAVEHAEAKRFGGAKSFGSYSRSSNSTSQAGNRATTPPRQATNPARSNMPRFLGPLAGVLAGGLIASLLFGGAFDGIRFMDILLIALVAFIAFRFLRRRTASPQTQGGAFGAPHQAQHREMHTEAGSSQRQENGSAPLSATATPEWFDREQFLGGAKEHFMTLQRAWDNNDLEKVQEYVTPELYNLLRQERAEQPANNRTDIVRLFAELGDVREFGQQAEATVIFHGLLNENGEETEFNETWHLTRQLKSGAPWYIQGIEQNA